MKESIGRGSGRYSRKSAVKRQRTTASSLIAGTRRSFIIARTTMKIRRVTPGLSAQPSPNRMIPDKFSQAYRFAIARLQTSHSASQHARLTEWAVAFVSIVKESLLGSAYSTRRFFLMTFAIDRAVKRVSAFCLQLSGRAANGRVPNRESQCQEFVFHCSVSLNRSCQFAAGDCKQDTPASDGYMSAI